MTQNTVIPNTFQNPNTYVDIGMELLTAEEYKCLSFAVRHIYGWRDTIVTLRRPISFTMFQTGYTAKDGTRFGGTGLARKAISDAIKELVHYKVFIKGAMTDDGQEYIIGEAPDWDGLRKREADKHQKSLERTAAARAKRSKTKRSEQKRDKQGSSDSQTNQSRDMQLVALTTPSPVSPTDYAQLDGLTDSQLVGLPELNPIDQTKLQTQKQQEAESPLAGTGAPEQPAAATDPIPVVVVVSRSDGIPPPEQNNPPPGSAPPSPQPVEPERPNIFKLHEDLTGSLSGLIVDELKDAEKEYPAHWVEEAFTEAARCNKRSWAYVHGILKRYRREGFSPPMRETAPPNGAPPASPAPAPRAASPGAPNLRNSESRERERKAAAS